YDRAKNTPGVRFIWSKVSVLRENPETKSVTLRYRTDGTGVEVEEFDLTVLSIGLVSPPGTRQLAEKLSIELNEYGFSRNPGCSPLETSRPGIYACGVFRAPMDIPDSVTMASGAASLSSQLLAEQKGTLITEKEHPPERDVSGEPPRIGVFVCHCGTNIARVVDVPRVVRYAKRLDNVVHVEESTFACSIDSVSHITNTIREHGLNRLVVAACTPRTHEPVFQEALREAGLNPHLFEMANIREQCSWVHMADRRIATQKAQDLVRMAVSKARLLKPLHALSYEVVHSALVIGGGIAGLVSALALSRQGYPVHLVEKAAGLGGIARRIHHTVEGRDVQAYLHELIEKVEENSLIQIHKEAAVTGFSGYVGNFATTITDAAGTAQEINHGVTIVATGAEEFRPAEYGYGADPKVLTLLELEAEINGNSERVARCQRLVMIQCVGSRNEEHPYCSRVCCSQAIKNALKLKEINPEMEIYILYRDMRTYALREDYYREAAEHDVRFIHYEPENKPEMEIVRQDGRELLRVHVTDPTLGQRLMLDADLLALGVAAVAPESNRELSQLFKVPLNEDNFFMEAHMKLRPVDFATEGIFMCGLAHYPKFIDESIAQAEAAASRAVTILSRDRMESSGLVCTVDKWRCTGCALCEEVCPFNAISVDTADKKAVVNEVLCKGCGVCASSCRSGALTVEGFSDQQTMSLIQSLFV
ncbi:MAG: FAD-dependent oxidoreductase, partial [Dehalococcoidales bacterium]|nr:FAD-dependent oxidoreductase [Dehalococcoidales bacterium]